MKRLLALLLIAALALTAAACSSGDTESTAAVTVTDDVKSHMDEILEKYSFQGVVYLTLNGEVIYRSVTGKDESGEALNVDSTMYVGSVSKQFCAAAILMLRDGGKLSVDDKLEKYFPEYEIGKDITLKNLLSMRSGIPEMLEGDPDISPDKTDAENTAAIMDWIFAQPLSFEPDSSYEYTNSNYFLLANIVEQVSGQTYNGFVRENIFEPLGMTHSGFVEEVKDAPDWARGLSYGTFMAGEDAPGLPKGAGNIASNAPDMDRWMTGLSSGKVISTDSYLEMIDDYSPDFAMQYGYGLMRLYKNGIGHPGVIGTYYAVDYRNEEYGLNLFVATNKEFPAIENMPQILLSDLLEEAAS